MNENWNRLEEAVEKDPALRERFRQMAERLAGEGLDDPMELLRRCADELGFQPDAGAHLELLSDEEMDNVAGGSDLSKDGNVKPFRFNSWVGAMLRDLLKKNSAAGSVGMDDLVSRSTDDVRAETLPRPSSPEIHELHCL